ncbi:riboflavin synthase [Crocosphaera sp. UHCC 0190]|uniref:riboflavin synthase n=1 Tax=Crocosphaera sp. UHCC 0190 TaxID=3110246 RepID=UPI002B21BAFC|nr:riboflavin synthase [Crocosphaera sp. UHCC 0190]MEA5512301.1 riboflavin synthase [Crocosphaera sp. UHCC 0190]
MFTGLIQGLGILYPLESDRFTLSIFDASTNPILSDLALGDSVAVDGVCLTVEEIVNDGFVATASPETLQRTTLTQKIQTATYVNIEPSLRVGSKLGGHFVTGHIDGIGCLQESISTDKAWEMTFAAPSSRLEQWHHYIGRYLIPKGSVAVNGISLTVADCDRQGTWFKAAVIPHTYHQTNLCHLKIGDWVNIEGDILGKYVAKLLGQPLQPQQETSEISLTFLTENGYL